jgi:hypothetical protein
VIQLYLGWHDIDVNDLHHELHDIKPLSP